MIFLLGSGAEKTARQWIEKKSRNSFVILAASMLFSPLNLSAGPTQVNSQNGWRPIISRETIQARFALSFLTQTRPRLLFQSS